MAFETYPVLFQQGFEMTLKNMHCKRRRKKRGTTKMRKEKCKRVRKNVGKVQARGLSVESFHSSPGLKSRWLL